ncbi:MAG: hypothetical protein H7Z14_00410 [Anaerolineae bacterium]|nr:hypothetical protein [Phycisphaerae bacterium]
MPGALCGVVSRSAAVLVDAFFPDSFPDSFAEPFFPVATAAARPGAGRAGATREGAPRSGTRANGLVFLAGFNFNARAGADFRAGAGGDFLPPEVFFKALVLNVEGFFTFDLATEPLAPFGPELSADPSPDRLCSRALGCT